MAAPIARRSRAARLSILLVLVLLLCVAAAAAAARAPPNAAAASLAKKKKHGDDDDDGGGGGGGGGGDKPSPKPPAPSPPGPDDDDDTIAQMKACHAERGKGKDACLAVPHCEFCSKGPSRLPLPDVCVHELEAKLMPGFLWECSGSDSPPPANADACEGLAEPACAASKGVCVWCVAAAVPSSCFTVDQAAKLPPGVFNCGVAPSLAAVF